MEREHIFQVFGQLVIPQFSLSGIEKERIPKKEAKKIKKRVSLPPLAAHDTLSRRSIRPTHSYSRDTPFTLSDEGVFKLRDVVKPLTLFCSHLALMSLGHLFNRQTTRKSDTVYT